jgi:hypothetical protein
MGKAVDKKNRITRPRATASARRIAELLKKVETYLASDSFKPTVADYIKLIQLYKEFKKQQPRHIEVTWIDAPRENELNAA